MSTPPPLTKKYYHGSSRKGIKTLRPRYDPRTKIKGVFLSEHAFAPMIFALLKNRAKANIHYTTHKGTFVFGRVISPTPLLEHGYLYTVDILPSSLRKTKHSGEYYLKKSIPVSTCKKITKKQVLIFGWKIIIKKSSH